MRHLQLTEETPHSDSVRYLMTLFAELLKFTCATVSDNPGAWFLHWYVFRLVPDVSKLNFGPTATSIGIWRLVSPWSSVKRLRTTLRARRPRLHPRIGRICARCTTHYRLNSSEGRVSSAAICKYNPYIRSFIMSLVDTSFNLQGFAYS